MAVGSHHHCESLLYQDELSSAFRLTGSQLYFIIIIVNVSFSDLSRNM